jgi:hypothetical protein
MKITLKVREEDADSDVDLYIENATEPKDGSGPVWRKGMVRFGIGDMTAVAERSEILRALESIGDG